MRWSTLDVRWGGYRFSDVRRCHVYFQVFFPCLFGTLVYWIMGLAPELLRYLTFLLVLVLTANAACSMGYAISTLTGHDALAFALGESSFL